MFECLIMYFVSFVGSLIYLNASYLLYQSLAPLSHLNIFGAICLILHSFAQYFSVLAMVIFKLPYKMNSVDYRCSFLSKNVCKFVFLLNLREEQFFCWLKNLKSRLFYVTFFEVFIIFLKYLQYKKYLYSFFVNN